MDPFLVDGEWLERHLHDPGIVVLDATWHLPETARSGADDFRAAHIPGARHFDLERVSDRASPFVNMAPPAEQFAAEVGALGVSNDSLVVAYDSGYVSARVWWMFRLFGHERVRILDGGFRRWRAEGRPVETGEAAPFVPATFRAEAPGDGVATKHDVLRALEERSARVLDARTAERFTGALPSGYPGVPGGHMPGAENIPWGRFQKQSGDFAFATPEEAERLFQEAGVGRDEPVIVTCGSGVTAAILGLMLQRTGRTGWRLYDGSWHEWAQDPALPKASVGQTA